MMSETSISSVMIKYIAIHNCHNKIISFYPNPKITRVPKSMRMKYIWV